MRWSPQNLYFGYVPIGDGLFRYGLALSDELQEKEKILNHLVFIRKLRPVDDTALDVTRMLGDLDRSWLQAREGQRTRMADLQFVAEQLPNRNSRILLDDGRDVLGTPRVKVDWRWTKTEPTIIRRFCELFAREVGSSNVGRVKLLDQLDDEKHLNKLYQKRGGGTHHMGTTRMSISPKDGVVDVNCRVHEMSNLFCAGSSVFPTASWVNPTLTILALSIRLADHLKRLLRA
jgi:choline dehydrogenase-like flavoprotein